ncbi:MAG: hypothetical protein Q4D72_01130 [Capnocytophaga sp.]|nr:hypothetical protein [Capnocytophaga sp.]
MSRVIFAFLISIISSSCVTNYYTVSLAEDTVLYSDKKSEKEIVTIPKNTRVYLSSNVSKRKYKRLKWKDYYGWVYEPKYISYKSYVPSSEYQSPSYSNKSKKSSGGSVNVRGYYRKNGTYVRPHTRSSRKR